MPNKNNSYRGSIIDKLYDAEDKNPSMSMGEILHSIRIELNKPFYFATDSEVYTAIENFVNLEEEEDEPLGDQEFLFWIEQQTIVKQ